MHVLGGLGAAAGAYFLYQRMRAKPAPTMPFVAPASKGFFTFGPPKKSNCSSEIAAAAVAKKEFQAAQEEFATISSQMPASAAKLPDAQTKLAKAAQRLQLTESEESMCKRQVPA